MKSERLSFSPLGELLHQSKCYPQSVEEVLRFFETRGRRLNFAELARRSGLRSRSYARQVFLGRRRPTLSVLQSLLVASRIPAHFRSFILSQFQLENERDTRKRKQLEKEVERNRRRLVLKRTDLDSAEVFQPHVVPRVFAALGSREIGASLDEISKRTGLALDRVQRSIEVLEQKGVARFQASTGRAYPVSDHLIMNGRRGSPTFKEFFLDSLKRTDAKAKKDFKDSNCLFSACVTSVRKERLPELSEKLWQLILDFVDEIEDPEGDTIVSLHAALHDGT